MSREPALTASFLLALAAMGFTACSSSGGGTAPGDSVVIAGTSHVIWKSDGGGLVEIPPTAACHFEATYDLDLSAGALTWHACHLVGNDFSDPSAYVLMNGSRVLTADERAQAIAASRAVTVADRMLCGADKPQVTLEVDGQSGSILYGDDFYSCENNYAYYVDTAPLDQLGTVLDGMSHNP